MSFSNVTMYCSAGFWVSVLGGVMLGSAASSAAGADAQPAPRVFVLRAESLALAKQRLAAGDAQLDAALKELLTEADAALPAPTPSVMDKPAAPPSGDKHDYMSLSPYWWPDPDTADGLPYVRRDGEVNPERKKYDVTTMGAMVRAVKVLGFAYYFTGEERYAQKAAEFLRVWFVDPATRMNPNLTYAQGVPGRADGRCYGIIDTAHWPSLIDAIALVEPSPAWSADDRRILREWFRQYLDWLLTSPAGVLEASQRNNHATWYAVQATAYALFVDDADRAKALLERVQYFIAHQIEPDGGQPHEIARTKGLSYSSYNLSAFLHAARLGEHVGMDLWTYETDDGRSIRKALEYLIPYGLGEKEWTAKQITSWHLSPELLRRAATGFRDARYEQVITKLPADAQRALPRLNLLECGRYGDP